MRILLVGGAGHVAGLILPRLAERHEVRVLDLRRPEAPPDAPPRPEPPTGAPPTPVPVGHVVGDATDPDVVAGAVQGVDAVLHCAMAPIRGGMDTTTYAASAVDVHVKSVHVTLRSAFDAGARHAVVISSMSVFGDLRGRTGLTEEDPPDAVDPYGLTKRLGEQVCAAAVQWGMSVNVLRLSWPTPDEVWPAWQTPDGDVQQHTVNGASIPALAGSDLARAVLAALEHRDGFQLFTISGDHDGRMMSLAKARDRLGWEPAFRLD